MRSAKSVPNRQIFINWNVGYFITLGDMIVVNNQAEKYCTDHLMNELSTRPVSIRFAGCPHAKETERRQTFLDSCLATKRLLIVVSSDGLNFDLPLCSVQSSENDEISFESVVILNGVSVRWKGSINRVTLTGMAHIEYDSKYAEELLKKQNSNLENDCSLAQRISKLQDAILRP